MAQGRVKWFDAAKGYGFSQPEDGGKVFVHVSEVRNAGYLALVDGALVSFEVIYTNGKHVAGNLLLP